VTDPLRGLLDAAIEGDDVALADLVRCTQDDLWRLCCLLGSGDAEDLVQETYLRAVGSLRSYRGDAPVRSWLMAIARHVCADQVRARQRHRRLVRKVTDHQRANVSIDGHLEAEVGAPTAALIDHLEPARREAFLLTQVIGLSYDEAAVVIGCPIGTIRSRVARARGDLADMVRRADIA